MRKRPTGLFDETVINGFIVTFGTSFAPRTVLIVHLLETMPYAILVRSYKLMSFIREGRWNSVPRVNLHMGIAP